ncbi:MAG: hypothetical protein ACFFA0_14260 [Promethearchaeota archaeon]
MSLKILDKEIVYANQETEVVENFPDISELIIPFSVAFKNFSPPDIYNGDELIPFQEKDLEFKEILVYEFLTELKDIKKESKEK